MAGQRDVGMTAKGRWAHPLGRTRHEHTNETHRAPPLVAALALLTGCAAGTDGFGLGVEVEGIYAFEVSGDTRTRDVSGSAGEPWYVMEDDGWALFFGPYGTFLTEIDSRGHLRAESFEGSLFTTNFEGLYLDGAIGGELIRRDWSGDTEALDILGAQEIWADPTAAAPDVEGFYALSATILAQDCVALDAETNLYPSPFEYPSLVFQSGDVLLFSGHGVRFQANLQPDGSFEADKHWESPRGTFDMVVTGAFDGPGLELTFEMTNDVFNNGVVDCGSTIEVLGEWVSPWYDDALLLEFLTTARTVYFTPLDFVLFH